MFFFQNHNNLQYIYTFGASRLDETLTFENRASRRDEMLTFETFSPGGRPWGAYRSRGVQISLFRCWFLFSLKSEFDDSYTL